MTGPDYEESEVKRAMTQSSREVIALATVEKLGTAEAFYVCPTDQLTAIVTDQSDQQGTFKIYRDLGIKMV